MFPAANGNQSTQALIPNDGRSPNLPSEPLRFNLEKSTDYSREFVPRAIYNDQVTELLLRQEGVWGVGNRVAPEALRHLRQAHAYTLVKKEATQAIDLPKDIRRVKSMDPLPSDADPEVYSGDGEGRMVILMEHSIEIINLTQAVPILPIPGKPRNMVPSTDVPVYYRGKHKSLPPGFQATVRFGSGRNIIARASTNMVPTLDPDDRKTVSASASLEATKQTDTPKETSPNTNIWSIFGFKPTQSLLSPPSGQEKRSTLSNTPPTTQSAKSESILSYAKDTKACAWLPCVDSGMLRVVVDGAVARCNEMEHGTAKFSKTYTLRYSKEAKPAHLRSTAPRQAASLGSALRPRAGSPLRNETLAEVPLQEAAGLAIAENSATNTSATGAPISTSASLVSPALIEGVTPTSIAFEVTTSSPGVSLTSEIGDVSENNIIEAEIEMNLNTVEVHTQWQDQVPAQAVPEVSEKVHEISSTREERIEIMGSYARRSDAPQVNPRLPDYSKSSESSPLKSIDRVSSSSTPTDSYSVKSPGSVMIADSLRVLKPVGPTNNADVTNIQSPARKDTNIIVSPKSIFSAQKDNEGEGKFVPSVESHPTRSEEGVIEMVSVEKSYQRSVIQKEIDHPIISKFDEPATIKEESDSESIHSGAAPTASSAFLSAMDIQRMHDRANPTAAADRQAQFDEDQKAKKKKEKIWKRLRKSLRRKKKKDGDEDGNSETGGDDDDVGSMISISELSQSDFDVGDSGSDDGDGKSVKSTRSTMSTMSAFSSKIKSSFKGSKIVLKGRSPSKGNMVSSEDSLTAKLADESPSGKIAKGSKGSLFSLRQKGEKEDFESNHSEKNEQRRKEAEERDRQERLRIDMETSLQQEQERLEKERLEIARIEEQERQRLEKERLEKERAEKQKLEKERLEKERLDKERLEKERFEKERQEKERLEKERLENERSERARLQKEREERWEKERLEQQRREIERLERELLEKVQTDKALLEKEALEKEHAAITDMKNIGTEGKVQGIVENGRRMHLIEQRSTNEIKGIENTSVICVKTRQKSGADEIRDYTEKEKAEEKAQLKKERLEREEREDREAAAAAVAGMKIKEAEETGKRNREAMEQKLLEEDRARKEKDDHETKERQRNEKELKEKKEKEEKEAEQKKREQKAKEEAERQEKERKQRELKLHQQLENERKQKEKELQEQREKEQKAMEEAEKSTNAEQEKAEDAKRKLEEQEKSERAEKERARREAERKEQELKEHELQKGKMKRDPDQKSRSSTTERAENLRKSHSLADELSKPPTSAEKDSDAVSVKSSKSVKALAAVFGGASKKDDKEKDKEKRKSVGKLSDSKGSIDNLKEKVDAETKTVKSGQVSMKGTKCEVRLEDSELHCIEGKGKPAKHFFPLELRRIVSAEHSGATTTLHACTPRKGGKSGSKLKKIVLQWTDESLAKGFAETLSKQVYGESPSTLMRSVLVLVDKYDGEAYGKLVTKYMKPVWDAVHKPCEIKTVQFNEFSVANALSVQNFKTVGNIICTNPEFMSKLMQVIVRNSYSTSPLNLPVEPDPVDSALTILRSSIGKGGSALHVTSFVPKREEGMMGSFFKKK